MSSSRNSHWPVWNGSTGSNRITPVQDAVSLFRDRMTRDCLSQSCSLRQLLQSLIRSRTHRIAPVQDAVSLFGDRMTRDCLSQSCSLRQLLQSLIRSRTHRITPVQDAVSLFGDRMTRDCLSQSCSLRQLLQSLIRSRMQQERCGSARKQRINSVIIYRINTQGS